MSLALYIVPERKIAGFDSFVSGKALGHCEHLARLAGQAGVRPLTEFFSQDPAEAAAFLEDQGIELPAGGLPAEPWFSPEHGLASVRGLLDYLAAHPEASSDAPALVADLKEVEEALARLAAEGIGWRLAMDF